MKFFDPKAFADLTATVKSSVVLDETSRKVTASVEPSSPAPRRPRLR